MSKIGNWAEMDRRVRERQPCWNDGDQAELEAQMMKTPDLTEHLDVLDVVQPALAQPEEEAAEDEASAADATGAIDASN